MTSWPIQMPPQLQQPQDDAGFTLLELVVALALSSGLMLLSYNSLSSFIKVRSYVTSSMQVSQQQMAFSQRLTRLIGGAQLFDARRSLNQKQYPLSGDDRSVSFSAQPHAESPVMRYRLSHDSIDGSVHLESCYDLPGENMDSSDECSDEVLATNIYALNLAYAQKLAGRLSWRTSWLQQDQLPKAVRVTLRDEYGRASSQRLTIRLLSEQRAHCNYDPVSRRCR